MVGLKGALQSLGKQKRMVALEKELRVIIPFCSRVLGEKARMGLSFYDLNAGKGFSINGDKAGWAASIIKIPIMIEVMKQCSEGKISLEEKVNVNHALALEKGDTVTTMPEDEQLTVFELLCYSIIESDNEAANMLADKVSIASINETMEKLGLKSTRMSHLMHKKAPIVYKGIDGTGSNTTSADDMAALIKMIYMDEILTKEKCALMRAIMEYEGKCFANCNNTFRKYIPKDKPIGRKCGEIDNDVHECAAVNYDYVLCIMSNRLDSPKKIPLARELIGRVSQKVYEEYYALK